MNEETLTKPQGFKNFIKKYEGFLVFLLMFAIFTAIKPAFLSLGNIGSILTQTALLGITASGITVVMISGGMDMSMGAVAGAATLGGLWNVCNEHAPLLGGLLLGLAIGAAFGAINGFCVSRLGVAPFVATLGTMFIAQGLQYYFSKGGMAISYGFPQAFRFMGTGKFLGIKMPIIIYLVVFLILLYLLDFAPTGRYFTNIGKNQYASELTGIKIRKYTFIAYVVCSVLAAALGMLLCASQSYASCDHGSSFLMDSLLAALLGKTLAGKKMSIAATAFGCFFLRTFEAGLAMVGINVLLFNVLKGILLILALVLLYFDGRKVKN